MKYFRLLFAFFCVLNASVALAYKAGEDYKVITPQLETSSGKQIEILEFFWYGCPHCYQFEPHVKKWKESKPANVNFVRVPVVFRPSWKVHARMYYALEELGQLDKLHEKVFEELHVNKKGKRALENINAVTDFVVSHGVDRKAFTDAYNSFSVDSKVRKSIKLSKDYGITGVPTVGVNGKYSVNGPMAKTYENLVRILDDLIKQESN